jgi:hypothetical protein
MIKLVTLVTYTSIVAKTLATSQQAMIHIPPALLLPAAASMIERIKTITAIRVIKMLSKSKTMSKIPIAAKKIL